MAGTTKTAHFVCETLNPRKTIAGKAKTNQFVYKDLQKHGRYS